jgi:hypothetical protein
MAHFEERVQKGDLVEVKTAGGRSFTTPEKPPIWPRQLARAPEGSVPLLADALLRGLIAHQRSSQLRFFDVGLRLIWTWPIMLVG